MQDCPIHFIAVPSALTLHPQFNKDCRTEYAVHITAWPCDATWAWLHFPLPLSPGMFPFHHTLWIRSLVCLARVLGTWQWYLKSVGFMLPERRWFMEMFRNKMSFVSGVVHFECFHKLITTYDPKATFGAGLAESGSTSTAVNPAGTSLPNILAAWSISVMCSHQPHLERCEVAVGRKQGLPAGLTAPREKAFSKSYGNSQRHWWQSSQYLLLSQSCTCRLFVQN